MTPASSRSFFPKPYADAVARLRVPAGFVLVAAFLWFSRPSTESIVEGVLIALPGLLLRGWAAGHLRKDATLTTSGPYAFIRNPLYAGTLIVALGMAHATREWPLAVLFLAVFLLVYLPAIALEEQHLAELFPNFGDYVKRVPLLIPYRRPIKSTQSFSASQYVYNREYEAAIGFLAGIAFLLAKASYFSGF